MNTINPLSWSCQPNLHLRSAMKNTNTPLDGAYLADFGIDITVLYGLVNVCASIKENQVEK